jgi:hypothetical protein
LRGVLGALPRAREKGRITDPPTVSRTALSATLLSSHLGVLQVEEILRWILDAAKDDKAGIDDILMAGKHRTVCPHAARATTKRTHIEKMRAPLQRPST